MVTCSVRLTGTSLLLSVLSWHAEHGCVPRVPVGKRVCCGMWMGWDDRGQCLWSRGANPSGNWGHWELHGGWTLGLQCDTCQNPLVREVTVLTNINSTEQLFSACGILPFGILVLPTAGIFLSPDRAIPAASWQKQLHWFLVFSLVSQLWSTFMGGMRVCLLRFLLIMHVKWDKYLILYRTKRFISKSQ